MESGSMSSDFLQVALLWAVQFMMLVGLVGLVIPVFPGLLVIWLSALGYGVAVGFDATGLIIFAIMTVLAIVGSLADNLLMGAGARTTGAAWSTVFLAMVAGVLGTLVLPPFGGLIAAPLAVFSLEYYRKRDWKQARQAVFGVAAGWGMSFAARFTSGLLINGLWWLWVWLRS
jgi:uncharacterized protein